MTEPKPPRKYCGALPPWSREASCLNDPGHTNLHRSMDGRQWDDKGREFPAMGVKP